MKIRIPKVYTDSPSKNNYKREDVFRVETFHMTIIKIFNLYSNSANFDHFINPLQENLVRAIFIT